MEYNTRFNIDSNIFENNELLNQNASFLNDSFEIPRC